MDPTNKPLDVTLDGKQIKLYFDIDTMEAFEDVSGKGYMNWVMQLWQGTMGTVHSMGAEALNSIGPLPEGISEEEREDLIDRRTKVLLTKQVDLVRLGSSMTIKDFRCILWASYHEPAGRNRPARWPMTIEQIRAKVDESTYLKLSGHILGKIVQEMSRKMGITKDTEPERPTPLSPTSSEPTGGRIYGPSDEDVLASIETK